MTVGQDPVGTVPSGNWVFNMTLQDTRAAGSAYVWITVFSCNQQDVGRSAPAAPTCTFLFKNWDNTTNIKATANPTSYTYTKASVPQFTNVQVLYVEYWIHYATSGGDPNDLLTLNSGYGNNGAYIGFSVKSPGATYWPNLSPGVACSGTCAALSTSTGAASTTTSVTMASTNKFYVRPTVTGSASTGTPHFQGGTVIASGWQIIDNGFIGTSIAAGTWTVNLRSQASFATNPMVVDSHGLGPGCNPGAGGTCTVSVSTTMTTDIIVLFVHCNPPGTLGTVSISDGNSLTWNTRVPWQQVGSRSQGEWWALSSGTLTADTVTATFSAGQTACTLLFIAINGANTVAPYDTNGVEPATVNGNSPTSCTMTTNSADVILFGEVGQGGAPTFTPPSGWTAGDTGGGFEKFDAWRIIAAGVSSQVETWTATAGSNISGLCDAIVASITAPGTANLWVSVFSCNVPNLGQAQIVLTAAAGQVGQTCAPVVKNWDNVTNILSTAWTTRSYSFSGNAFASAAYLYLEVWVAYTVAAGSTPTVAFTVQDASSSVAIPSGSTYYLTAQPTNCSNLCQNLFYYVGTQALTTTANIASGVGTYQVRPAQASATRGSPSTSSPDGYAWITEGQVNGTVPAGVWKFTMSVTDSVTGGAAFLWFSVWNCARPNVGQPGSGCALLFKDWDNSTNIKSNAYSNNVYLTPSEPAFKNVRYLAIELWVSETSTTGAPADIITFHMGDSESLLRLPSAVNRFYYTTSGMTCAVTCRFLSSTTGAADATTHVTLGALGGVQFEVRPYMTSATTAAISTNTVVGSGWETATPLDSNITSGTWRFNVTASNTVASGTANLWLKVYSCPDSLVASPPNCVFLFKFYDNSTNLLAATAATKYSFTTPSEPLFHGVQHLYIEYWLNYAVAGTGDSFTLTTVSAASSVETPPKTAEGQTGLQIDGGKVIDSAAGQQQLRISTSNKNSLVYLEMSQATTIIGFTFVTDNANLTWNLRSVKVGTSDIMYVFYAVAGNLLQGDVVTVGTGIAAQAAMSITVFTGENAATPFDSGGSEVATTRSVFSTPACNASSCTLPAAANVAQNDLLIAALMYTVPSATCNTFTTAADTFGSALSIVASSTEVSGGNCAENAIAAGYAGSSGSDAMTINFNPGTPPANQRAELFELLGVSNTVAGTSTGSSAGATSISTSGSVSYNTNDFVVSAWTGLAAVTTLTPGPGFATFAANFRSDGEFQSALSPGSTNFPMTVAPNMAWAESGAVFKAQSSAQPSVVTGTNAAPMAQLSTTHSNDIVIGAVDARTVTAPTAGPGFTLLSVPVTAPSTITMGIEYARFVAPKTLLNANFTLSSSVAWIMYGDAVWGPEVRTPSDAFVFSDSPSRMLLLPRAAADAYSGADSPTRTLVLPRPQSDVYSFSDAASRVVNLARSLSDSFSFSEVSSRAIAFSRGVSDLFTFSESAVRSLQLPRLVPDSFVNSDTVAGIVQLPRFPGDTFSPSDSASRLQNSSRGAGDSFAYLETTLANVLFPRFPSDSSVVSDVLSRVVSLGRSASDVFGFLESSLRSLQFARSVADSFTFGDLLNQMKHFVLHLHDAFPFADVERRSLSMLRQVLDVFDFGDVVARALVLGRGVVETFTFETLVAVLVRLSVVASDVFRLVETVATVVITVSQTSTTTPGGGYTGSFAVVIFFFLPFLLLLLLLVLLASYLKRRKEKPSLPGPRE